MRVHELAKELNINSKELIDKLLAAKLDVKSHMSALTDDQVSAARKLFQVEKPAAASTSTSTKTATATAVMTPPPQIAVSAPAPQPTAKPAVEQKPPEPKAPAPAPAAPPTKKTVLVRGPIIVREFAEQLGLKPNQLIAELMAMNVFASINQRIELKTAQHLAEKHGAILEHEKKQVEKKPVTVSKAEKEKEPAEDAPEALKPRAPVVTFMGHVDHGKTSLLDRIRNAKVASGEAGGITQHIGAYTVKANNHAITFLDTPGHEAFTGMRARGANLTDIVVIVIDAVDGVMPQTREAIQHAKAANVAIMVALNKIDLRAANPDRVKTQLQQEGLVPEDWGGTVVCCPVSAVTGAGIDHLLEMILLQAEILELKANPARRAQGYVLEAQLEPGMGPTATFLVRRGTLNVGDAIVCGPHWGRVKALINDQGEKVKSAGPSYAVKCLGLSGVPEPGTEFVVHPNDRMARQIAEERVAAKRLQDLSATPKRASLEDFLKPSEDGQKKELALLIKTDVQGSLEAIQHALSGIKSNKITLNILLTGVGGISVNDVLLARASSAIIIGFNVTPDHGVSAIAKREGVEIRLYSIIYELLDQVKEAMTGLLDPIIREHVIGHAEIRQVFELSKKGKVAGCLVKDGRVTARARARIKRSGSMVYAGSVGTLRRFQNEASEVREGQECGLRLENFSDYQAGDIIEFYEVEKIAQQL